MALGVSISMLEALIQNNYSGENEPSWWTCAQVPGRVSEQSDIAVKNNIAGIPQISGA